jgi:hypothetical protein
MRKLSRCIDGELAVEKKKNAGEVHHLRMRKGDPPSTPSKNCGKGRALKTAVVGSVILNETKNSTILQVKIEVCVAFGKDSTIQSEFYVLKCLNGSKSGTKECENWSRLATMDTPFLVHYHRVWFPHEPYIFLMDLFPVCKHGFSL